MDEQDKEQTLLRSERILRALDLELRDRAIRRGFRRLRAENWLVDDAVRWLAEVFLLSESRVRAIVYQKSRDNG